MHIRQVIPLLLSVLAASWSFADLQERTWVIDGTERKALVWMPEATNSSAPPLVFGFHGHGGSARNAARSFRMHELWPEAVVVYMQGLPTPGALTDPEGKRSGWNSDPDDAGNRDLKFFDAVYESLSNQVDTNRVYSMGHSNGGGFTYGLWAARGERLAAVAASAAVSGRSAGTLSPLPALHIAGENDPLVKYRWQATMMERVRRVNGCTNQGQPWQSAGALTGTIYTSEKGAPFISLIHPGSHTFTSDACPLIVDFFKAQERK